MIVSKQMVTLRVWTLLLLLVKTSVGAQQVSSFDEVFSIHIICHNSADLSLFSNGRTAENADISSQYLMLSEADEMSLSGLTAKGIVHRDFIEMFFDMHHFHQYCRDGVWIDEKGMVELANRNTLTASDINRELVNWEESEYFLSSQQEIQILEIRDLTDPEFITVGALEPVPEPSVILLFSLSSLLIARRKR